MYVGLTDPSGAARRKRTRPSPPAVGPWAGTVRWNRRSADSSDQPRGGGGCPTLPERLDRLRDPEVQRSAKTNDEVFGRTPRPD